MKRSVAFAALAVLLTSALFCFFSCKKTSSPEKREFTVTFSTAYLSSAAEAPADAEVEWGSKVPEPKISYEAKAGHTVRWVRDPLSSSPYDFTLPVTESFTLYAVELPKKYKINYLLEMGVNSVNNPAEFDRNDEMTLHNAVAPFGYKFIKWAYFDDPESTVTRVEKGTEGDLVLRAVFSAVRYDVLFIGLDGADDPNRHSYLFGEEMPLVPPSKEGYRFLGFSAPGDLSGNYVSVLTPAFVEENQFALFNKGNGSDITLIANWEKKE